MEGELKQLRETLEAGQAMGSTQGAAQENPGLGLVQQVARAQAEMEAELIKRNREIAKVHQAMTLHLPDLEQPFYEAADPKLPLKINAKII